MKSFLPLSSSQVFFKLQNWHMEFSILERIQSKDGLVGGELCKFPTQFSPFSKMQQRHSTDKMSLLRSSYNNFIVRTLLGMWANAINWHPKIWWFSHFLTMCCCNQIFKTECFDYRNVTNLQCTQQIKAICQVCRSDPL